MIVELPGGYRPAPPRLPISLKEYLFEIYHNQKHQEKMMSDLSDAVAAVQTSQAKLSTDMNKAFIDLQAAVAASGNDSADVASAVAALGVINASMQSDDAAALAADPANAAPAPVPSP